MRTSVVAYTMTIALLVPVGVVATAGGARADSPRPGHSYGSYYRCAHGHHHGERHRHHDCYLVVAGPQGRPGRDGVNGKDGAPGKDGTNGTDGTNGATPAFYMNSLTEFGTGGPPNSPPGNEDGNSDPNVTVVQCTGANDVAVGGGTDQSNGNLRSVGPANAAGGVPVGNDTPHGWRAVGTTPATDQNPRTVWVICSPAA